MAGNIKGITIEIGGDTTGLQKALKGVDTQLKSTQSELKKVEKKLKLDPTNTELLVEKQKLLNDTVRLTSERLETLEEAARQAAQQLEAGAITKDQYDALNKEIQQTKDDLIAATKEADNFSISLEKAKGIADKISTGAQNIADKTKGMSTAAAGVLGAIGGMAVNAAKSADELNTLSKQSGLSTDDIQKIQYASDLVDVSTEDIISAQTKLINSMSSTSSATQEAFEKIGVATTDANGELRNSSDVFYEVLQGLSEIPNETERDAAAMDIFGKSASSLAGIIDDGGAALKDLGQQAEDLGIIMDEETLTSLNAVNDQLDTLKANAQGQIAQAGATAMEALMPLFEQVIGYISSVLEWIGSLDEDSITLIATIAGIVAAISPVAGIISGISGAVSGFLTFWPNVTGAFDAIMAFMAANPIAAIGIAVGTLVALIIANWDTIKPVLEAIWEKVKDIFDKIKSKVETVIDTIQSFIKNGINGIIGFINKLIDGINGFIGKINAIKLTPPKWVTELTGIGSLGFNLPTINKLPMLAQGGLLSGGSAIVGEAGAELLSMTDRGALVQPLTNYNTTNNYNTAVPAVDINFTGNLAQLARVLQPHIALETTRRG